MSEPCAVDLKHGPGDPVICLDCRLGLRRDLEWIVRTYRLLSDHLSPQGSSDGVRTVPSSTPPLRTEVLSLEAAGGISGILGSWVQLLVEEREVDPPNYRLGQAALVAAQVTLIKAQASWLVEQEFVRELVTEVSELQRDMRTIMGEAERTWTPLPGRWTCPVVDPDGDGSACGTPLRQRRGQWLVKCRSCGSEWSGEGGIERLGRLLGCQLEVTVDQAALLAKVSRATIHRWIAQLALPATIVDGVRVVDTRDLALVLARRSA